MKKIVAALTASGLALALAACGSNTATNASDANDVTLNDTVLNDELPADVNLGATGNGADFAPVDPLVEQNGAAPANAQ